MDLKQFYKNNENYFKYGLKSAGIVFGAFFVGK